MYSAKYGRHGYRVDMNDESRVHRSFCNAELGKPCPTRRCLPSGLYLGKPELVSHRSCPPHPPNQCHFAKRKVKASRIQQFHFTWAKAKTIVAKRKATASCIQQFHFTWAITTTIVNNSTGIYDPELIQTRQSKSHA